MDGRFKGDLPHRTFEFAKAVFDLVDELPRDAKGWTVARQLVRSGTSIGANVEEASQALTDQEFVHRCSIARKEARETRHWLRLCAAKALLRGSTLESSIDEVDELLRILGTIVAKSQKRLRPERSMDSVT